MTLSKPLNLNRPAIKALAQELISGQSGYRTGQDIVNTFEDYGFVYEMSGESRAAFAENCLNDIQSKGSVEDFLIQMVNPINYPGDSTAQSVMDVVNNILLPYGASLVLVGVKPNIIEIPASTLTHPRPNSTHLAKPNFAKAKGSAAFIKLLEDRWEEAVITYSSFAPRMTVIALGGILEGALLAYTDANKIAALGSKKAPRDNRGSLISDIDKWKLEQLIDVVADLGWIHQSREKFSHVVRQYRNYIHPAREMKEGVSIDQGACDISWIVVKASLDDLMR